MRVNPTTPSAIINNSTMAKPIVRVMLGKSLICIITGKPELRKLIYERDVNPPEGYVDKPVDENGLLVNVRKIFETKKEKKV